MAKEELLRIIDLDGTHDSKLEPKLPPDALKAAYRHLVLVRLLDTRMLSLQRQGRIGFYVPSTGEEACQVGSAMALEKRDWVFPALVSSQVFAHYEMGKGDIAAGFAAADLVVEGTYRVGHTEQLYIENQAMIAVPREDGGMTVTGSLQCPYYVHKALKRALALDSERAVVIQAETGGGFGGKEEYPSLLAVHAALLAQRIGRPVRMIYGRHEDIAATTKRHPAIVTHRTGVTREGRIVAQEIDLVLDGGAYCTLSPVVLSRATIHAGGPYDVANVRITSRAVATNTPPNGAFRGFGAPQAEFAAEMQVNRVAEALGISPLELRRRNIYREGGVTPTQQVLRESVAAQEVLERAAEAAEFERIRERTARERAARTASARTARGIGLALGWHGAGFTGSGEERMGSVASVELTAEGAIRILAASTEMGQGTKTIFPQLVADELAVRSVVSADDVGWVIHPVLAEGQVEGGTLQAVGYATIEEIKLHDGSYLNDRLQTYLIPTAVDAPRIDAILVEAPFSGAPHGAKGVGELPMDVGAPAVVAAIHDATGVWIHDLPASPERILAALDGHEPPGPPGISA